MTQPFSTSLLAALPGKYAKFLTSAVGLLVVYLQSYGATWHLVPAVMAISAALGVMGVPNKTPEPSSSPPAAPPANV